LAAWPSTLCGRRPVGWQQLVFAAAQVDHQYRMLRICHCDFIRDHSERDLRLVLGHRPQILHGDAMGRVHPPV